MSVRVRLTRVGSKKNPIWRVVVADQRSPRDGRVIEHIGRYNPQTQPSEVVLDQERLQHWLERGAQPTDTVKRLIRIASGEVAPPPAKESKQKAEAAPPAADASAEEAAAPETAAAEEAPAAEEPAPAEEAAPAEEPAPAEEAPAADAPAEEPAASADPDTPAEE
jgi:small subunit ribosomal protein S16